MGCDRTAIGGAPLPAARAYQLSGHWTSGARGLRAASPSGSGCPRRYRAVGCGSRSDAVPDSQYPDETQSLADVARARTGNCAACGAPGPQKLMDMERRASRGWCV
jgi:hypothetical protein